MGLAVDEQPPDHSTLTVFRRRLERKRGRHGLETPFDELIVTAQAQGAEFGEL